MVVGNYPQLIVKSQFLISPRLDYQPLLGKMRPHSSPLHLFSGRMEDRARQTAEIEPRSRRNWLNSYIYLLFYTHMFCS